MNWLKSSRIYLISCLLIIALILPACEKSLISQKSLDIGPNIAAIFEVDDTATNEQIKEKLDIIIPVFNPGLSEDAANYKEEGVWPELRRAEANRFAFLLTKELTKTQAFGAVRMTPNSNATGDLYLLGKILNSNGQNVKIQIEVYDISGRSWFVEEFKHEVDSGFYKNLRNKGQDPYLPMFQEAANQIALELTKQKTSELERIRRITEVRFGQSMSNTAFSDSLVIRNGIADLVRFPSDNDPMLRRTRAIRVRDQLFVDNLQEEYKAFNQRMEASYRIWQEQSLLELEAERDADMAAIGEAALGVLFVGIAVLSAVAGVNSNSPGTQAAGMTGAVVGGAVGANLITNSFQTSKEAKIHRDALNELGESIDLDLAPQVIEFEERTLTLTGNAEEQFSKWRTFLRKIYDQEQTPDVKL